MAPSALRKALGAVKDQTSISLAKVASNNAPDLDVAIVKATSHDEIPIDEKYVYAILHLTSYSRGYVSACVYSLSKRIGKTHNWVVAIKALMLIHRLFQDGDPNFEKEVLQAMRRGQRLLNLADFRDDSHSNAWDYSAFVRTYALYLDERLDCTILGKCKFADKSQREQRPRSYTEQPYRGYEYSDGRYGSGGSSYRSSYDDFGDYGSVGRRPRYGDFDDLTPRRAGNEENGQKPEAFVAVRDMKPEMVLDRMPYWQRLLERFLASRPTGAARNHRLVHVSLYNLVRESFQLYKDITDGLAILLDAFFDMEYQDCVTVFDFYTKASKQIEELSSFYSLTKNIGVCRSSEYPDVQKISEKLLETLETFLKDRSASRNNTLPAPEPKPAKRESLERADEPVEDMNSIKALPAPRDYVEKEQENPKEVAKAQTENKEADLLDLSQANISTEDQENKLALALFSGTNGTSSTGKWETFSSDGPETSGVTSAWQTPLAEEGKAGWELTLVESASNLSKQKNTMSGGFDPLLLDGLYEQASTQRQYNPYAQTGSASSVVLPSPQQLNASYLALPAPPMQGDIPNAMHPGGDPFAASLTVPPPAYVQMADITRKQQMLLHEQQLWQQYQNNSMPHRFG
eukprot:TRINITY_DN1349_c0_g1_i1.p1 TRINITY_DN1349_c0_g1~~TRINITY_DN1349_c0_g1_i1.p1  ORF type:complete len:631 (-),score=95.54 TRINITY_DN1349_c0_g1_i1:387-2279(-)